MKKTDLLLNKALAGVVAAGVRSAAKKGLPPLPEGNFDYLRNPKAKFFTAGFGNAVLLPPDIDSAAYYIAGYSENNPAKGVIDPQTVSAMWLDDGSGRGGVLFLSFDAVGLLHRDVNTLKGELSEFRFLTGCRNITVTCTHNHAGIDTMGLWGPLPLTGKNKKFMRILFDGAKKAAFAAYADRREGTLFHGSIEVPDLQEDIRTPEVYSKILTRLRFRPADGTRETWFLNFAAHCESLQGCNSLVSADYPCYLREKIRDTAGAETVYAVGAVGGMISMLVENENQRRRDHTLLESTRKIGYRLADYAMAIENDTALPPEIDFIRQAFHVDVENPLLTAAGMIGIIGVDRYARPGAKKATIKTEMSYMEIGGLPLLFLPCELFPELAYGGALSAEASATGKGPDVNPPLLTEIAGREDLVIFGLADDEIGYVIPPNDFFLHADKPYLDKGIDRHARRHYEETNSAGPGTAAAIAETFGKMMETVKRAKGAGRRRGNRQ